MAELSLGLPAAMGHSLSFMSYQLVSKPVLDLDTHFKTIVFLLLSMVLDIKVKLKTAGGSSLPTWQKPLS
jgi:hypothetical protein